MKNKQLPLFEQNCDIKGAEFSPCRTYRYSLWRYWDKHEGFSAFVCLNPSTADESIDDPTVRRCINFSRSWGYGGMVMLNLFAIRSTDPKQIKTVDDPIGPDNDFHLRTASRKAGITIVAWGIHGAFLDRDKEVLKMLKMPHCLSLTKGNHPGHPLYLKKNLKPVRYQNGNNPVTATQKAQ